jgi:hypothetical protein
MLRASWRRVAFDIAKGSCRLSCETIVDFSNWQDQAAYEAAFQRLLRDLKARQSNPEGA